MSEESIDNQPVKARKPKQKRRQFSLAEIATRFKEGNVASVGSETNGRPQIWTKERLDEVAKLFIEWMEQPDSLYVNTFYWRMGIHPDNIGQLVHRSTDFARAVSQSKIWQEQKVVVDTWNRKISEGMTKMFLAKHFDYRDKTELSGNNKNPLSFVLSSIDGANKDITIDTNAIVDQTKDE